MPTDSTTRFSNRVEDYVKFRPGYPAGVLDVLAAHAGLSADAVVADVGAGTGISTKLLLESGTRVIAVEPNGPMRSEIGEHPRLTVTNGSAEATGLEQASVDLVTCFQSFHWFDPGACRAEFFRILKPGGSVALTWNDRVTDGLPFMADYDLLLKTLPAGNRADGHNQVATDGRIPAFFHPQPVRCDVLSNGQRLDFASLAGRLRSSSYTPTLAQPGFDAMMAGLREIFDRHQKEGFVEIVYRTEIYTGRLG
ncbi:MAG TPA: class I SAM-dependent methyltransferase [Tepidisphaeraceae bacterium]|jgi:SAM-dependent methyltransferase|nr:class I SAM-dependent methyltransferase [Tepidisphaeraceae bacterium]